MVSSALVMRLKSWRARPTPERRVLHMDCILLQGSSSVYIETANPRQAHILCATTSLHPALRNDQTRLPSVEHARLSDPFFRQRTVDIKKRSRELFHRLTMRVFSPLLSTALLTVKRSIALITVTVSAQFKISGYTPSEERETYHANPN